MHKRILGTSELEFQLSALLYWNELFLRSAERHAGDDGFKSGQRLKVESHSSTRPRFTGRTPTKNLWAVRWPISVGE